MNADWQKAKSLFRQLLDLEPDQRLPFLDKNCDDKKLRNEVLELIQLHESDTRFLESPIRPEQNPGSDLDFDWQGKTVGDFVLRRRIGSGGMGIVFEADQAKPGRKVAIKFLRSHQVLSARILRRFEHEAEVLARMEHPGIAKVLAAGTQDFGEGPQPWFAMELIQGPTLSEFLDQKSLGLREKLDLLLKIFAAVEHAHTRGVIHRDLKPSNILIAKDDSLAVPKDVGPGNPGSPKIVDFGIALLADQKESLTRQTQTGDIVGTIQYMSPEQVSGDRDKIDPRSDVYALGIIGFELLSGELPREKKSSGSLAESLMEAQSGHVRRLGQVSRELRGDLTTIFAKALQQEPDQRYNSVQEFSSDIRRFINRQPIQARPPSAWYLSRKFISRNWLLVTTTAAMVAFLIAGIIGYANQARIAREAAKESQYEADKAVAINSFMTNDFMMRLLAQSANRSPTEKDSRQATIDLVSHASNNISATFGERPSIEAAVRNEIGTLYYNLGAFPQARDQYQLSRELWESCLGVEHPDTLKTYNNLGLVSFQLGQRDQAEDYYRRALAGRIQVLGESNEQTLATMNNLAELLRQSDRVTEARQLFERALQIERRELAAGDKIILTTLSNYAALLSASGEPEKALELQREVYEKSRQTYGSDHITFLQASFGYARNLQKAEQNQEAEKVLQPIIVTAEKLQGPSNGFVISCRRLLSRILRDQKKFESALEQLHIALRILEKDEGDHAKNIRRIQRDIRRIENLQQ